MLENLTPEEKHRYRLAADMLKKQGISFRGGNFYELVHDHIESLAPQARIDLWSSVDWVKDL
jgi:hypothetical protein